MLEWRRITPSYENWPVVEVASSESRPGPPSGSPDETLLRWCQDAAIGEQVARLPRDDQRPPPADAARLERPSVLKGIRRERLDRSLRPVYDDLLIDSLRESGDLDELQERLARIPPEECSPHAWQAIENVAMARLARMARDRDPVRGFARALDLWDGVIRLPGRPARSSRATHRAGRRDGARRSSPALEPLAHRLRRAGDELAARPGQSPQTAIIAAERARIESRIGAGS